MKRLNKNNKDEEKKIAGLRYVTYNHGHQIQRRFSCNPFSNNLFTKVFIPKYFNAFV